MFNSKYIETVISTLGKRIDDLESDLYFEKKYRLQAEEDVKAKDSEIEELKKQIEELKADAKPQGEDA